MPSRCRQRQQDRQRSKRPAGHVQGGGSFPARFGSKEERGWQGYKLSFGASGGQGTRDDPTHGISPSHACHSPHLASSISSRLSHAPSTKKMFRSKSTRPFALSSAPVAAPSAASPASSPVASPSTAYKIPPSQLSSYVPKTSATRKNPSVSPILAGRATAQSSVLQAAARLLIRWLSRQEAKRARARQRRSRRLSG